MSCERDDRALALHLEGDLPAAEAAELERHLQHCARCRGFLARLEETQQTLRSLRDEPLDDAVLAEVRSRVTGAVAGQAVSGRVASQRWAWALAAAVAVLVTGVVSLWRAQPVSSPSAVRRAASAPQPSPAPVPEATPTAAPSASESTVRGSAAVSRVVERMVTARRSALSPEDADQLARAVVAVSRVQRLLEHPAETEAAAPPSDVVRLETANPDVVIYWQLDSSGG